MVRRAIRNTISMDNNCWLYARAINSSGYGSTSYGLAHRIMYQALVGEIPEGLQLDHLCKVKICVNPAHLEPVTRLENMRRHFTGICKKGHKMTGNNLQVYIYKGKEQKRCRQCANDYQRAQKRRMRAKL